MMIMVKDEAKWAYWEKHIKAWRTSGLSRNAYCQREGLKPTTFDYWRPLITPGDAGIKAMKQPSGGKDMTLVPVAIIAAGDPAAQGHPIRPPRGDAPFEMINLKSPSGWEMNLPTSIEPNWLIAVLRQLP